MSNKKNFKVPELRTKVFMSNKAIFTAWEAWWYLLSSTDTQWSISDQIEGERALRATNEFQFVSLNLPGRSCYFSVSCFLLWVLT